MIEDLTAQARTKRVRAVQLTDGTVLAADALVFGIGAATTGPNTGRDCAGPHGRGGHCRRTKRPTSMPDFRSRQYGRMLQFAGHSRATDAVRFLDGDASIESFTVRCERDGAPVAVFAIDNRRLVTPYRKHIERLTPSAISIS